MKRTALLIAGLTLVIGCTDAEPMAKKSPAESNTEIAKTEPGVGQDSATAFNESLISLTKQANDLEANFQFSEAAEAWRQIDSIVSEQFGTESWQAANARLAGIVASIESNFTPDQLKKLKQIQEFQKQFLDAFKANNINEAQNIADLSTQITKELFGEQSPMYGKQLLQSASLNQKVGNAEAAIREYHLAIENLKTTFHANHPDIESAHQQLGQLYLAREKFGPAISNHKASTRLSAELWGEDSLQYAKGANQLGVAYHRAGELDIAYKILQASELIRRRKLGPAHSLVAHSHLNLGIVCLDRKDYEAASQYLAMSVDGFAGQKVVDQNMLLLAKEKLSTVHMLNGKPELAEPLLGDAVESTYAKLGADHPQVAELQFRQGIALAKQGKYELAEPLLNSAYETQKAKLGPSHSATINTMKALALLLKQTRRTTEFQNLSLEIQRVSKASNSNDFQR